MTLHKLKCIPLDWIPNDIRKRLMSRIGMTCEQNDTGVIAFFHALLGDSKDFDYS